MVIYPPEIRHSLSENPLFKRNNQFTICRSCVPWKNMHDHGCPYGLVHLGSLIDFCFDKAINWWAMAHFLERQTHMYNMYICIYLYDGRLLLSSYIPYNTRKTLHPNDPSGNLTWPCLNPLHLDFVERRSDTELWFLRGDFSNGERIICMAKWKVWGSRATKNWEFNPCRETWMRVIYENRRLQRFLRIVGLSAPLVR